MSVRGVQCGDGRKVIGRREGYGNRMKIAEDRKVEGT